MNRSRRTLLKTLATTGAAMSVGGTLRMANAQALSPITVALSWLPNVEYAGLWIASERGYFKERRPRDATFSPAARTPRSRR